MNVRTNALIAIVSLGACTTSPGSRSYEPCQVGADCIYGTDRCVGVTLNHSSEQICTSQCTVGGGCPPGAGGAAGTCVLLSGAGAAFCFQTCASSSSCQPSEVCVQPMGASTQVCLPGGGTTGTAPPYAACATTVCVASTTCTTLHDGAGTFQVCTRTHCTTDMDCPMDAHTGLGLCATLDGDGFGTCVQRCNTIGDCANPSVQSCVTRTAGGTLLPASVCLPNR